MFKKPLKVGAQNQLSGKDKKAIKNKLIAQFDEESIDKLFAKNDKIICNKISGSKMLIYISDQYPLIVDGTGKEDYFPSLYVCAAYEPLSKSIYINEGVEGYIFNGANLMWPGVRDFDSAGNFKKDQIVSIKNSKGEPIGVGAMGCSLDELKKNTDGSGVAVYILHYKGDKLWDMGSKAYPEIILQAKIEKIQQPKVEAKVEEKIEVKQEEKTQKIEEVKQTVKTEVKKVEKKKKGVKFDQEDEEPEPEPQPEKPKGKNNKNKGKEVKQVKEVKQQVKQPIKAPPAPPKKQQQSQESDGDAFADLVHAKKHQKAAVKNQKKKAAVFSDQQDDKKGKKKGGHKKVNNKKKQSQDEEQEIEVKPQQKAGKGNRKKSSDAEQEQEDHKKGHKKGKGKKHQQEEEDEVKQEKDHKKNNKKNNKRKQQSEEQEKEEKEEHNQDEQIKQQKPKKKKEAEQQEGENQEGAKSAISGQLMDQYFKEAFLNVLKLTKVQSQLPIDSGRFFSDYMILARPEGVKLQIKDSTFKKLGKFYEDMAKQKFIEFKPAKQKKGQQGSTITKIFWQNEQLKAYFPTIKKMLEKDVEQKQEQFSKYKLKLTKTIQVEYVYKVTDQLRKILYKKVINYMPEHSEDQEEEKKKKQEEKKDIFLSQRQLREKIEKYINDITVKDGKQAKQAKQAKQSKDAKEKDKDKKVDKLITLNYKQNEFIYNLLKNEIEEYEENLQKEEMMAQQDSDDEDKKKNKKDKSKKSLFRIQRNYIVNKIVKLASPFYNISDKENNLNKFKEGIFKGIQIIADKVINKNVTKIIGLETFAPATTQPEELVKQIHGFAHLLQVKFASSASVQNLPGKNAGKQVVVQGNFVDELESMLTTEYGIKKEFITIQNKLGKKKKN